MSTVGQKQTFYAIAADVRLGPIGDISMATGLIATTFRREPSKA